MLVDKHAIKEGAMALVCTVAWVRKGDIVCPMLPPTHPLVWHPSTENIVLSGGVAKLADFGLAISSREEALVTRAGTIDYMVREAERGGGECGGHSFWDMKGPMCLRGGGLHAWRQVSEVTHFSSLFPAGPRGDLLPPQGPAPREQGPAAPALRQWCGRVGSRGAGL